MNFLHGRLVALLWAQLLRTEQALVNELGGTLSSGKIRKLVRFIFDALASLGLLSISEKDGISQVKIPHETQKEYAISLTRELYLDGNEVEAVQRWHEAFAVAYLASKVENERDGREDTCRAYAIEKLVFHLIQARMLNKAPVLLQDERFLAERFETKGFEAGVELHLEDCKKLQTAIEAMVTTKKIHSKP